MDIMELTRKLGAAIQEEPSYIAYQAARAANDGDEELQKLIGEFNMLRISISNENGGENETKMEELNEKLRACYNEIMPNENMQAFNQAKDELDRLVNQITTIITLCVNGEDPETCEASGCTGSCSGCSGCH